MLSCSKVVYLTPVVHTTISIKQVFLIGCVNKISSCLKCANKISSFLFIFLNNWLLKLFLRTKFCLHYFNSINFLGLLFEISSFRICFKKVNSFCNRFKKVKKDLLQGVFSNCYSCSIFKFNINLNLNIK